MVLAIIERTPSMYFGLSSLAENNMLYSGGFTGGYNGL